MRARGILWLLVSAAIGAAAFAGCGSDETSPTTTSTGTGGSGSTSTSTNTSTTTTTTTVSQTTGGGASKLAESCISDADCGPDLKCSLSSADDAVFGGGPAGGYCTKSCADDSECPSGGLCLAGTENGPKECILPCSQGPELMYINDPLDDTKCHAREDLMCAPLDAQFTQGGCLPTCGKDDQCDNGRVCDPRLGVCVDPAKVNKGLPAGSDCDPMADPPDCAGICLTLTGDTPDQDIHMCSSTCAIGGELDSTDCGGLEGGLCAYSG